MAGADVAPMAVGAGSFGGLGSPPELLGAGLDERDSQAVLTRSLELGVTLVDTAHSYAGGAADRAIGGWLAADPKRRDRVTIVAKVGVVARAGALGVDLTPETVVRCAWESRARLGVERVGFVVSHAPDPATPLTHTMAAFIGLLEAGHADAYGVSNVSIADLESWVTAADRAGVPVPALVENEYNLLCRGDEQHVLPLCRERGIDYLAHSPLASGLLSGKYRPGVSPPPDSYLAFRPSDRLELLAGLPSGALVRFERQARQRGLSCAALGLAWVAAQPNVRPIVGVRRVSQLTAVEQALSQPLTLDQAADVAAVFDGG